jgi:hypothetical protein
VINGEAADRQWCRSAARVQDGRFLSYPKMSSQVMVTVPFVPQVVLV